MERTKSLVSSMDEGVRRAKEGNYAFIGESVSLDLAVARHCELVRASEVVGMRGYSIAAALGEAVGFRKRFRFTKNGHTKMKLFRFLKAHQ